MAIRWRTHLISYSVTCHMILGYPWMHTVWPATSKPCPCPRAQHTDYDYLSPSRSQIPHVHSVAGVSSRYQSLSIPSTLSRHPYCLSRKLATERCRGRQYVLAFLFFSFFFSSFFLSFCVSQSHVDNSRKTTRIRPPAYSSRSLPNSVLRLRFRSVLNGEVMYLGHPAHANENPSPSGTRTIPKISHPAPARTRSPIEKISFVLVNPR